MLAPAPLPHALAPAARTHELAVPGSCAAAPLPPVTGEDAALGCGCSLRPHILRRVLWCFLAKPQMPVVEIYTREFCGYCEAAKALLRRKGIGFVEIDVTGNRGGRMEMMARAGGRTSVPQIFVGSQHLGGSDELHALERSGALDALLADQAEETHPYG